MVRRFSCLAYVHTIGSLQCTGTSSLGRQVTDSFTRTDPVVIPGARIGTKFDWQKSRKEKR